MGDAFAANKLLTFSAENIQVSIPLSVCRRRLCPKDFPANRLPSLGNSYPLPEALQIKIPLSKFLS
jgi:hypothetical protein